MYHYTHLTPFEREKTLFFLAEGKSITEIAHLLKRSKSTISRKLRRNVDPADQPIRTARWRHKHSTSSAEKPVVRICALNVHHCTPTSSSASWSTTGRQKGLEEIVGRIQLEHGCRLVSVQTIYRAIHAGLLNLPGASAKFVLRKLRHHRKRRHKKGREERRDKFVISPPSKIVLPAQRTVPSEATGKQIPWWASRERHASSRWWTGRTGTCLEEKPWARLLLQSTRWCARHSRGDHTCRSRRIEERNSRNVLSSERSWNVWRSAFLLWTIHGSAESMKTPRSFYGSSSRRARTSRIHRRITSNGSTMSWTCALGSALAAKHHMRSIYQRCCT